MRAILSVYDKTGVVALGKKLSDSGMDIISTGGTYKQLTDAKIKVTAVQKVTEFPEILDGRVKTLHPKIYGGLLARRSNKNDIAQISDHSIDTIDLVAVNLYPFSDAISKANCTLDNALENIDIGGPSMLRAAAKNFKDVIVIVDPNDYEKVADDISQNGLNSVGFNYRKYLAHKAFKHVSEYDAIISNYLNENPINKTEHFSVNLTKVSTLRYGENPHQAASLYKSPKSSKGIANANKLHGKDLSFNNILDADAAWNIVSDFDNTAVAIVKHNNPCGLSVNENQASAYKLAFEGDPVSAYGGILGFNRKVELETVEQFKSVFYEVIVAPGYDEAALELLRKRKNLRILEIEQDKNPASQIEIRNISGGALIQETDAKRVDPNSWTVVTEKKPTKNQLDDLAFAWTAVKHVKSNAIVLAKNKQLLGMGSGQPNRLNSIHLAVRAAGNSSSGSVLASDAFFPFADNIEMSSKAGVVALIQPGGSIRDEDTIKSANELGLSMIFTHVRHFNH
tara:strand:- start:17466 stop:18995 length:1530 start_codon:yes stop_codon:yes gene_type:complete